MIRKWHFPLIGVLISLIFLIGCDDSAKQSASNDPAENASVSFMVQWPDDEAPRQPAAAEEFTAAAVKVSDDCDARGVADVRISVQSSSGSTLKSGTFDCSAGQGTLNGVSPQNNCTVVVSGLNANAQEIYRGENPGVDLHAGPNNVGVIRMDVIDDSGPSGDTYTNSLGMDFVYIEPGTFIMGSPEDEPGRGSIETQHEVTLTRGYYLQTTEVTQGQWQAVMGNNPSGFEDCGGNCPVERVSWNDAQDFIDEMNKMGEGIYRLPTEAEWEYAARAGSTTTFANGEITETSCGLDPNLDAMGWYCGNSNDKPHPVAQKQANAWGLYDMHGNVWEWCQDWYGDYPTGSVTDPEGPSSGVRRVLRGGGWNLYAWSCRSANRNSRDPASTYNYTGFRLALLPGQ